MKKVPFSVVKNGVFFGVFRGHSRDPILGVFRGPMEWRVRLPGGVAGWGLPDAREGFKSY